MTHQAPILLLEVGGMPVDWLTPQEAVHYYATSKVAWELGESDLVFRGGHNRLGVQSSIRVKPIIAVSRSEITRAKMRMELPLGDKNDLLFRRDRHTCAYCGQQFPRHVLSRDHVVPRCKGGKDIWMNCVTACRKCNQDKGAKAVHEFRPLVYLPYAPCRNEHFLLSGRNVLADQHEYLAAHLPKHSRLL